MSSYYQAVGVTAVSLMILLRYLFRSRPASQHKLVYMAVITTTVIALLLPTFLIHLTLMQTGLLMAALAALAGFFIPVSELLPQGAFLNRGMEKTVPEPETEQGAMGDILTMGKEALEAPPEHGLEVEMNKIDEMADDTSLVIEETPAGQGEAIDVRLSEQPDELIDTEQVFEELPETIMETAPDDLVTQFDVETQEPVEETGEPLQVPGPMVEEGQASQDATEEALVAAREEHVAQLPGRVLPQAFSETLSEVMLMNAYLALNEGEETEAVEAFTLVCQRGFLAEQKMSAYLEVKRLLLEHGRLSELITLEVEMLEACQPSTNTELEHIQRHNHYLKRFSSLCHAHGVPLDIPYSAMPDELKDMAKTYQE